MYACVERSVCGALSVANVVVMELCTVVRRYLDIEAAVAGLSVSCLFLQFCVKQLQNICSCDRYWAICF